MKLADLILKGLLVVGFFVSAYYANGAWAAAERNYGALMEAHRKLSDRDPLFSEFRKEHAELLRKCGG